MRISLLLLAAGLLLTFGRARAQSAPFGLVAGSVAKVVQGSDTLAMAWAGGLNTPQFSTIDIDNDGLLDIYAFERQTNRSFVFLNVARPGGGRRYLYAPDYAALFPADLDRWALLRDYDCDGRADLFTLTSGGNIRVFHNELDAAGRTSFVLSIPILSFPTYNGNTSNLIIGDVNLPAIDDFNGDGKLDVLSYNFNGSTLIDFYINNSPGPCGISSFDYVSSYWGKLVACVDCGEYQLNNTPACASYKTTHSTGHNVLLLDLNGDGKLDLLDGRDNCPVLTRLLNQGTSTADALMTPAGTSSQWPSASAQLNLPVFPAAYRFDADFDGVPDLVIAPNMLDNTLDRVGLRDIVRLYHNGAASAGAVPSFSLTNNAFLQSEMLDVSEGAMPTFGDLDGDGLTDMLVGNLGDKVNGYYRANLSYYRNIGSARRPVFRLITADYLGLGATAQANGTYLEQLRPTLVDLNRDGALDLVYSAYDGSSARLHYLLNTAAAGQPVAYNVAQTGFFRIPGTTQADGLPDTPSDTPCFFDIDNDGYVDLLVGTNQLVPGLSTPGRLRYFRNRGAAAGGDISTMFALANPDYGGLHTGPGLAANLCPTVTDFDGDGTADLLIGDSDGKVTLYANFRAQSSSNFIGRTDLFYNRLTSQFTSATLGGYGLLHFSPAAADLDHDGTPELYIGTESGGIVSYVTRNAAVLATQPARAAALAFALYPNPAAQAATAETAQPTRLRLLDLTGRQVLADAALARTHRLDLRGLAAGVYIAQATAADGTTTTLRLAVQ